MKRFQGVKKAAGYLEVPGGVLAAGKDEMIWEIK